MLEGEAMINKAKELQILDYWYINEFLNQNSLEDEKIRQEAEIKLSSSENIKKVTYCISLNKGEDFFSELKATINLHKMKVWSNITVYLGKMKRECCIKKIAKILGSKEERPEESNDYIAWASLQLNSDGAYVEDSFDLSPILWALNQLKINSEKFSGNLSMELFEQDKDKFEERLEKELSYSQSNGIKVSEELWKVLELIQESYVNTLEFSEQQDKVGGQEIFLVFKMYHDEETKEKNTIKDFAYSNLSQTFYMDDIKWIYDRIASDEFGNEGMAGAIRQYITEFGNDFKHQPTIKRNNIINVKDNEKFKYINFLINALDIKNTPIAKWPSKYRPSLMQQIAVNASTSKIGGAFPDVKYPIFTVNGPPGSGKTTLLKEIIASNVVERAKYLAEYQESDNAFTVRKFKYGVDGNPFYNQYHKEFYSLKNNRINDYGMLVVSNNNTAVENITKELPQEKQLLKDLQGGPRESKQIRQSLNEIISLFSIDKSEDFQEYGFFHKDKEKDIYFSKLASNLQKKSQETEEDETGTWGLIAAPLGKRANISNFTYHVLNPVLDILSHDKYVIDYRKRYKETRKKFLDQLALVEELQRKIECQQKLFREYYEISKKFPILKKECHTKSKILFEDLTGLETSILKLEQDSSQLQILISKLLEEVAKKKVELKISQDIITKIQNDILEKRQLAFNTLDKLSFWTKLQDKFLGGGKQKAAQQLVAEYDKQCQYLLKTMSVEEINCKIIKSALELLEKELKEYRHRKSKLEEEIQKVQTDISYKRQQINQYEKTLKQTRAKYLRLKNQVGTARIPKNLMESYVPLNQEFIDRLLGSDEKEITRAQVENPWLTERYDREREKLFYFALKLNKYFVLSSKCCRRNLHHLFAYMAGKYKGDNEYFEFHPEDRRELVPSIYHTLFLLVPVISSTFASIGKFLADVKEENSIGMLIIDEAGQAQPQMALGALYRSKRAIIVGDPRQVEPIVKDDLRLLKGAFRGEIYAPYKVRNISIQKCADLINPYGNYLENGTEYPEWVGSPLVVHRRCISPMYEISNTISYNGMMRQQTKEPTEDLKKTFVGSSCWINITGNEENIKNHYIKHQGKKAVELVFKAFELVKDLDNPVPSLFIITPFNTVRSGISKALLDYKKQREQEESGYVPEDKIFHQWIKDNVGTIHKFQGKEADQVIFLLGCDTSKAASGAINWVNKNIVNVAVTRAKYRLYVIGDIQAWQKNEHVQKAKAIIDTYKLKELARNTFKDLDTSEVTEISNQLPSIQSFPVSETVNEAGEKELSVETTGFITALDAERVYEQPLTDEELNCFGFRTYTEFQQLSSEVRRNIEWGIKLYFLLRPIYLKNEYLDASCCAILFCKALELHVKDCLEEGLKNVLPNFKSKGIKLAQINTRAMTLGAFSFIIKKNVNFLSEHLLKRGFPEYNLEWLNAYRDKLTEATRRRNECCHAGFFKYIELDSLLKEMFEVNYSSPKSSQPSDGLIFTSEVGKKL